MVVEDRRADDQRRRTGAATGGPSLEADVAEMGTHPEPIGPPRNPRERPVAGPDPAAPLVGRGSAALSGVLAAGVALGVAELVAGALRTTASPVVLVGDAVIDLVPGAVERWAIRTFGTNDKIALVLGIIVLAGLFGGLLGVVGRRRFLLGAAGFVAFAAVGVAAASADQRTSTAAAALSVAAGAAAGIVALRWLLVALTSDRQGDVVGAAPPAHSAERRRFLRLATATAGAGAVAAVSGRWLAGATETAVGRVQGLLPVRLRSVEALPPGVDLEIEQLTPYVTPNESFYRIDTALVPPRVDVDTWRLRVTGLVDQPLELSFDDLVGMELMEHWTTLVCVSNEVGGGLVGNALWGGVHLQGILDAAGVRPGASQIVGRSVDGWTAGFPTEAAGDGRAAMVAVAMNGEPLPIEHGFPARLVVPGLYGYVSATKWLSEIELTTFDDFDAYWVPRGWSELGPVLTQSRIDVPDDDAQVVAGPTPVAGVAWAQGRGIADVEVRVDEGPWQEARLAPAVSEDTWRQWVWVWEAEPGRHVIQVRATDRDGETQTPLLAPPAPSGATGHHTITVTVVDAEAETG